MLLNDWLIIIDVVTPLRLATYHSDLTTLATTKPKAKPIKSPLNIAFLALDSSGFSSLIDTPILRKINPTIRNCLLFIGLIWFFISP